VMTDVGFTINPTATFDSCPQLDVVCVPGGPGVFDQLLDAETLAFLQSQAVSARYLTSVCNGSLILGAAGLLDGYKSACHWIWRDYLANFGARADSSRVVRDRNRFSGAGVTSGIDFAFSLLADLTSEEYAKTIQLRLEYDPQPPFNCGSPSKAEAARVASVMEAVRSQMASVEPTILKAASTFRARSGVTQ
jgi:cyclohexyl-isocyanide hydratase